MPFPVVLDACVLVPHPLVDALLRFADEGTYRPLWSEDILAETRRTMVDRLNISAERADYRIRLMRENFIDAEITGYKDLIPAMNNHEKDRHVLAAAVRERAEVIVTKNLKHFPDDALKPYQVKAINPDDFLLDQLDLYEEATKAVILGMVDAYTDPPFTPQTLLDALGTQVPHFAVEARRLFPPGSRFGFSVLLPFDR
jgi:predicted nucleic acid-binding protein